MLYSTSSILKSDTKSFVNWQYSNLIDGQLLYDESSILKAFGVIIKLPRVKFWVILLETVVRPLMYLSKLSGILSLKSVHDIS